MCVWGGCRDYFYSTRVKVPDAVSGGGGGGMCGASRVAVVPTTPPDVVEGLMAKNVEMARPPKLTQSMSTLQ